MVRKSICTVCYYENQPGCRIKSLGVEGDITKCVKFKDRKLAEEEAINEPWKEEDAREESKE